ncbi:hypothetical protein SCH4B_1952 [Ruegeria sp. TrichCH4B]|jgi:hypothetical protein|nr:hypothetical protein SCH4B_1952 [Ruegeria sp. TrichCH4B]
MGAIMAGFPGTPSKAHAIFWHYSLPQCAKSANLDSPFKKKAGAYP